MNNDDLKSKIAGYAWLIAIVVGAVVFVVAYNIVRGTGRDWPLSLGVAVVLFLISAVAIWLMASNVVDAYTLDAADNIGDVSRLLAQVRSNSRNIRNSDIQAMLEKICKDTVNLVKYTRKRQPDNILSCATVLEEWLKLVVDNSSKCVDIGVNPEYYKSPSAKYATALKGFEGFDKFLVNSIALIVDGQDANFENNAKMLDASRFNIA